MDGAAPRDFLGERGQCSHKDTQGSLTISRQENGGNVIEDPKIQRSSRNRREYQRKDPNPKPCMFMICVCLTITNHHHHGKFIALARYGIESLHHRTSAPPPPPTTTTSFASPLPPASSATETQQPSSITTSHNYHAQTTKAKVSSRQSDSGGKAKKGKSTTNMVTVPAPLPTSDNAGEEIELVVEEEALAANVDVIAEGEKEGESQPSTTMNVAIAWCGKDDLTIANERLQQRSRRAAPRRVRN